MPMWNPAAPQTQRMKKKKRLVPVWLLTLWIHCCCSPWPRHPWAPLSSSLTPSKRDISSWTHPALTTTGRSVGGYLLEDGSFVQVGGLAALEDLVLHIHSNGQDAIAESRHGTQPWAKCLQIGTKLLKDVYSGAVCLRECVSCPLVAVQGLLQEAQAVLSCLK